MSSRATPRMLASVTAASAGLRARGLTMKNVVRMARGEENVRQEALRACAFILAGRVTPVIGVDHDGVRYLLSAREATGVCFPTFVRGYFDEAVVRSMLVALARHSGITTIKGFTVLEVGANIGTETISLLVRHGIERVVAVEPDAENVRFLRANLALNGVEERATIYQLALSDIDGIVMLERTEDNWGDHRVRVDDSLATPLHGEEERPISAVLACRLDSLVASGEIDLNDIDLVWIDAQGHEGHIFDGAEALATAGVPIVTEYWPYGLRRAGALDRFHALVAQRYGTIVDLREPEVALDGARVTELAYAYGGEDAQDPRVRYTDLLLLP